jgi:hypothetical protein
MTSVCYYSMSGPGTERAHQMQIAVCVHTVQGPNGPSKTGYKLLPDKARRARLQILFI